LLAILIALAALSAFQGFRNAVVRPNGSQDNQWGPSRMLLIRENPYANFMDPDKRNQFILSQYPNYPASGLIMLWPYAAFEWPTAKLLWAVTNFMLTGLALYLLFGFLPEGTSNRAKILLSCLLLMSTPWRSGIGNGQHAVWTLTFILLAIRLCTSGKFGRSAALAASWFKYSIAFPITLFFCRGRKGWVTVFSAALIHAVLTIALALYLMESPLALLKGPIEVAMISTTTGVVDVMSISTNIGLDSNIPAGVAALLILSIAYWATSKEEDMLSALSTLSLTSMTLVTHLNYDFIFLVIPLAYVIRERGRGIRPKLYLLVILAIWFVDKAVISATNMSLFSPMRDILLHLKYWTWVVLFYTALLTDWILVFNKRKP
jgi:hypothetical protein